jgi:hypothetical protein
MRGAFPQMRIRIDNLTSLLHAIRLQAGKGNSATKGASLGSCILCNRRAVLKCGEGHALCVDCIEEAIMDTGANYDVRCLIDGCSSQPFTSKELCKHMHVNAWDYHSKKNIEQGVNEVKELQKKTKERVDEINDRQKEMASVIDKCLPGWALQNANAERLKLCPTVVVITPSAVDGPIDLKTWFKKLGKQKYNVVFYCERSFQPGHEPFEISVNRKWMVTVAPWLRIAINIAANWDPSKLAPAVLKEFQLFRKDTKEMKALIEALGKVDNDGQLQTLQGDAFEAIRKMANKKENLKKWRNDMEPVVGEIGRTMWVKKRLEDSGHWC